MKPQAPYRLETERLILRAPEPAQAAFAKAAIDPNLTHLAEWMPWAVGGPVDLAEHIARLRDWRASFDRNEHFRFELLERDSGRLVGGAGLMASGDRFHRSHSGVCLVREIGYWVAQGSAGRGYATEMTKALVRVGFEYLKLERIIVRVEPDNTPSRRVAEKAGFRLEGIARADGVGPAAEGDSSRRDLAIYALLPADYAEGRDTRASEFTAYCITGERLP